MYVLHTVLHVSMDCSNTVSRPRALLQACSVFNCHAPQAHIHKRCQPRPQSAWPPPKKKIIFCFICDLTYARMGGLLSFAMFSRKGIEPGQLTGAGTGLALDDG